MFRLLYSYLQEDNIGIGSKSLLREIRGKFHNFCRQRYISYYNLMKVGLVSQLSVE